MNRRARPTKFVCNRRNDPDMARLSGSVEYEPFEDDHHYSQPNPFRISNGGLKVEFLKLDDKNEHHERVVSLRTDEPILPHNGIEYFELKVYTKIRDLPAAVSIGIAYSTMSSTHIPGLDRGSLGYQGEDGSFRCRYSSGGESNFAYGPPVINGDTVGCGVDFVNSSLFFTKNGINLGVAYSGNLMTRRPLYFTVGIKVPHVDHVLANFGSSSFMFDIENVVKYTKNTIVDEIDRIKLPLYPEDGCIDFNQLVVAYLLDNAYVSTAEAFSRAAGIDICCLEEAQYRSEIRQFIHEGQVREAVKLVNNRYPELFISREPLFFRLRVREFVDQLILLRQKLNDSMETDDVSYTTDIFLDFSALHKLGCAISKHHADLASRGIQDDQRITKPMKQAFALLAYNNPEDSPFRSLLSPWARHKIWEELKEAILECTGRSKFNLLKTLVGHNALLMKIMNRAGLGAPAFVERLVFEK